MTPERTGNMYTDLSVGIMEGSCLDEDKDGKKGPLDLQEFVLFFFFLNRNISII